MYKYLSPIHAKANEDLWTPPKEGPPAPKYDLASPGLAPLTGGVLLFMNTVGSCKGGEAL